MLISNEELNRLIKECKTSKELHELQINCTNEVYGRITDRQAMKILREQQKLEQKERELKR